MLQAHHNHDPDSPHSGYIMGVCHNIAVEVFDSVSIYIQKFLEIDITTGFDSCHYCAKVKFTSTVKLVGKISKSN